MVATQEDTPITTTMTFQPSSSSQNINIFGQHEQQQSLRNHNVVSESNLENIHHNRNESSYRRNDSIGTEADDTTTPSGIIANSFSSSSSSSSSTLLPEDYVLTIREVLCGRGKKCYDHIGNEYFRQLVTKKLLDYVKAPTKTDKTFIIREVIHEVRTNSIYGGFIKYNPLSGRYYKVSDVVAREKTSQAFRDSLYNLYKTKSNQALLKGGVGPASTSPSSSSMTAMSSGVSPLPVRSSLFLQDVPVSRFNNDDTCSTSKSLSMSNSSSSNTIPQVSSIPSPSWMTNISLSSAMSHTMDSHYHQHPHDPIGSMMMMSSPLPHVSSSASSGIGPSTLVSKTDDLSRNIQVALNDDLLSFLKKNDTKDVVSLASPSFNYHNTTNQNNMILDSTTNCGNNSLRVTQLDLASFVSNNDKQMLTKSTSTGCGLDDFRISPLLTGSTNNSVNCSSNNSSTSIISASSRTPRTVSEDPIIPSTSPVLSSTTVPMNNNSTCHTVNDTNLWDHLFMYAARTCDPHTNPYEPTPISPE